MRYFVTAVGEETEKLLLAGEIEAPDIDSALRQTYALGQAENGGRPVRVTHLSEQRVPSETCSGRLLQEGVHAR